jgi:hypothetical protein
MKTTKGVVRPIFASPTPHKLHSFFRENGVTLAQLTGETGYSSSWLSQLLLGYAKWSGPAAYALTKAAMRVERELARRQAREARGTTLLTGATGESDHDA